MKSNGMFQVGDKVIVKAGKYAPVTYCDAGEPRRHTLGDVKEVHQNFVAVNFAGYPNTVDMINSEIQLFNRR